MTAFESDPLDPRFQVITRRPFHRDEPSPPDDETPRECKRPHYGSDPAQWHWKYRYETAEAARAGIPAELATKAPHLVEYECGYCGWWHFGAPWVSTERGITPARTVRPLR